jgi:DNA-binding NtrC family response regulator
MRCVGRRDGRGENGLLVNQALRQFAVRYRRQARTLSAQAIEFPGNPKWPCHVRQLMHAAKSAATLSDHDVIGPSDFGLHESDTVAPAHEIAAADPDDEAAYEPACPLAASLRWSTAVEQIEEQRIHGALARYHGNNKRVAVGRRDSDLNFSLEGLKRMGPASCNKRSCSCGTS